MRGVTTRGWTSFDETLALPSLPSHGATVEIHNWQPAWLLASLCREDIVVARRKRSVAGQPGTSR
eukprot:958401-Alexandrium_andersonii.AAC.1